MTRRNALRRSANLRREIHGPNSEQYAIAIRTLGCALISLGRYDEALDIGCKIDTVKHGPRTTICAQNLLSMGTAQEGRGDIAAAESTYREVLSIRHERRLQAPKGPFPLFNWRNRVEALAR